MAVKKKATKPKAAPNLPDDPSYQGVDFDAYISNLANANLTGDLTLPSPTITTTFDNSDFYRGGGARDNTLLCQFSVTNAQNSGTVLGHGMPQTITLPFSPNGVTYGYNLRSQVFNTLGGQVVQILGIDITQISIFGQFGFENWFGKKWDPTTKQMNSLYDDKPLGQGVSYVWDEAGSYINGGQTFNGPIQMAHWFRAYFDAITQPHYDDIQMIFSYPHRGWLWKIRPFNFPQISFSHDAYSVQWEVDAYYVDYLQDATITNSILPQVQKALTNMSNGVGKFTEFLKWSEPTVVTSKAITAASTLLGANYGAYVSGGYSADETQTLIENGMSYTNYGSQYLTGTTG